MPQVISFPKPSTNKLRLCEDAVSKLTVALKNIRVLLDRCPDSPTKADLWEREKLIEELVEDAKVQIRQLKRCA
jgi:DNA-binding transcriptional MerR regulator